MQRKTLQYLLTNLLLLAALLCLILGWTQPALSVTRLVFFEKTFSMWSGLMKLWEADQVGMFSILLVFSFIFPMFKILALLWICNVTLPGRITAAVVHFVHRWGIYSMLDVLVIAVYLVVSTASGNWWLEVTEVHAGIYYFAAAILLTSLAAVAVQQRHREVDSGLLPSQAV